MKRLLADPVFIASLSLALIMCVFTLFGDTLFNACSLDPAKVSAGQYWRLFTANLVHFGWIHTSMNVAALLLCAQAFFIAQSLKKYLALLACCCLTVGLGIFWLNPEYIPYAGLSGAIHGLIVAGLIQTRAYPAWIRLLALALVAAKLIQENSASYEASDLQALIPVAIAVESHVYGAIAGALFALGDEFLSLLKRNR